MLLLIDNYDSFTYNLYQYLSEMGQDVQVVRNDTISTEDISNMAPERIVISPGPSTPENAGVSSDVVRVFGPHVPLLGVCLGHQCVGHAYGAIVHKAGEIMHGKSSRIHHSGVGVFADMPNPLTAIRYHSLIVEREGLPDCFEVTAWTDEGLIMGLRHREHPVQGIQFHPESFMTECGKELLRNFVEGGSR